MLNIIIPPGLSVIACGTRGCSIRKTWCRWIFLSRSFLLRRQVQVGVSADICMSTIPLALGTIARGNPTFPCIESCSNLFPAFTSHYLNYYLACIDIFVSSVFILLLFELFYHNVEPLLNPTPPTRHKPLMGQVMLYLSLVFSDLDFVAVGLFHDFIYFCSFIFYFSIHVSNLFEMF